MLRIYSEYQVLRFQISTKLIYKFFPRMLASRVALDSQGRLILRENGKIILPFEHFANAVMLKHMNGPHGLHLSLESTIRAVSIIFLFW